MSLNEKDDLNEMTLDIKQVRHTVTDRDGMHLVAHKDSDRSLCGIKMAGLTKFGSDLESLEDAAKFGAWINIRDDMCSECAEVLNYILFNS